MTESIWNDQPRRLLLELGQLVTDRAAAERDLVSAFEAAQEATEKQYQEAQKQAASRHAKERADTEAKYHTLRDEIIGRFQLDHAAAEEKHDQARAAIAARFEEADTEAKKRLQDARWQSGAVFEATRNKLDAFLKEADAELETLAKEMQAVRGEAEQVLRRRRQWRDLPPPLPPSRWADGEPRDRSRDLVAAAKDRLRGLQAQSVPALFEGSNPLGVVAAVFLVVGALSGLAAWHLGLYWIPVGVLAAIALCAVLLKWLAHIARQQSMRAYADLVKTLAEAELARHAAMESVRAEWQRQTTAATDHLNAELKGADEEFARTMSELVAAKEQGLKQTADKFAATRTAVTTRHNSERRDLEERSAEVLEDADRRFRNESSGLAQGYTRTMTDRSGRFQRDWDAMTARWFNGMRRFEMTVDEMNAACDRLFPEWDASAWAHWSAPTAIPPVVPFARLDFRLSDLEGGMPRDQRLLPTRTEFSIPVPFPFCDHSLLLFNARDEGRAHAVDALRAIMLRMLTSLPPGKVRFLIIDPVGLGESFSAFMHLADYNEQMVSNRIWTDCAHFERRLAELTEHMENVIQVYLRNEFRSLQEYNESAGELAEPYRVLVIANFPANFSEAAAQRLLSIVSSGARCGVYTLMSLDAAARLPRDFQLADLQRHAIELGWREGRFLWDHPELGPVPLVLESPPSPERFTELVRRVGREAKDADRIELPFEWVVPEQEEWWTGDSGLGVDVPLGRAGVTKLQHLQLGRGTSQHVLLAGKTGSGKSTLMHVLIMNVAMRYSPDEVELYLIDFKKGVEFKAYAELELPHARVVAIESEREFGLSVLERLDWELKRRGDLFRERGVQDLQGFRTAEPGQKMPRVLLVIDEFQELFVEDDRIAQNATLLLDRLVRQGRAFGIHVLLGSQTLAGAYSIPRATIGQMAVRIALQCSESDAHLILSEENTAARLLSRPGEAIYNDANGLYEGNHPFQVVWLSDEQREEYLKRVKDWAGKQSYAVRPAIVFEGNLPADPARNLALRELLDAPAWPVGIPAAKAWLGDAVAIKEPTAATFVRQSGANLLLVGHQEEAALGILATGLVGLAAQNAPLRLEGESPVAQFYVLDGTRPDAPHAGFFGSLVAQLPHTTKVVSPRTAQAAIGEIAEELARREQAGEEDAPPIYLVVFDLARFRDLRKAEDDFGFSRLDSDKPQSPAQQFRKILHDGPALGIHVLLWADGYNTALRSLDRQGLEDVELRVAFRMNPGDSSSLIDSPAASQLGVHRALFDDEGLGRVEKFRPYGPPTREWLLWAGRQLQRRVSTGAEASPR